MPVLMSTMKRMTSASSMARYTCLLISLSKTSSLPSTQPPVSTTLISMPFHSMSPYWRSRVVPLVSFTIAARVFVKRLKRVDLPTFGRPTIATNRPISVVSYQLSVLSYQLSVLSCQFFSGNSRFPRISRLSSSLVDLTLNTYYLTLILCIQTAAACSPGCASLSLPSQRAPGRRASQRTSRCPCVPRCPHA